MNKQETAEAILVMQAWIDGGEIEMRNTRRYTEKTDAWRPPSGGSGPNWNWWSREYRTKPKAREWWVKIDPKNGRANELHSKNDDCEEFGCIKVREVL